MQYGISLILAVCLFFSASLSAQQYPFVHYTPKDGLVNSRVRKAYQDSKGRMYFTTYGGLSVYDGARFKNYTTQNGLLTDLVNDVLEVGDDSLLVAVNTNGLNVLVHGQIKQSGFAKKDCPVVNQFLRSNDGNIYTTTDDGLYKLNKTGFTKLPAIIPVQHIAAEYLGTMVEYKDFLVFASNDLRKHYGLFLYHKKTGRITDALPKQYIRSLIAGDNGIIWLSTDKSIMQLDTSALIKGKLTLIKSYWPANDPASLTPGTIHFNQKNELLVLADNREIIRYSGDGAVLRIPFPETGLSPNFFIDREDVLWLCDGGTGVYKLPDTKLQSVSSFFVNNKSGIRTVTGIAPGSFWIVMNNGQWILHTEEGSKNFRAAPAFDAYFIHAAKKYLYAADPHNLFIAPLPKQNENILHFKKLLSVPDTVGFGGISATDRNGNIIIFETRNILVMQDDHKIFTYPLLPSDLVQGMHIDANNRLWVISRYNGLQIFSLHPENPSAYLKEEFHFLKEFEGASPRCMTVDGNGILWVGTRFKGLMGFIFKNDQLKNIAHFQSSDGLTDNFITSIACDGNNNIIIGTQTGLDRLIKTSNGYRLENVTGSNNIFTYIQTVWTDRQNNVFALTSANGILKAEPAGYANTGFEPQLFIDEIKVNGKAAAFLKTSMRLNYQQRNIIFSVAAPAFTDEKQVKYSYLLSGSQSNEWSVATRNADITLLNLAPGKYTLQVKAIFPSTSYAEKTIAYPFTILPPWWQTWWFRIAMAISGIVVLAGSIRLYYRRKLEKQKTILEKQQAVEKERTRIATDMHDDLGAGLSTIRFLSEKVKRNTFSDVTKADAEKIVTNSNDLVQKMNEIIWAMNEKNDTLEDLLFYTRSYAAEYCEENNLVCETHLPEKTPQAFVSGEVRRNIFLTVKESLHNIVKHANAKKVIIDFMIDTALMVTIKDNGRGFSEKEKSNGSGLRNMRRRIESVNGVFEIVNENGVMVKVIIPLPV